MCAFVALYPMETVINRLMVQGTRTIIDNTDSGVGVIPINTRYDGFFDCVQSVSQAEGSLGFYKGIGALALEAMLCVGLLKLAKSVATRVCKQSFRQLRPTNKLRVMHKLTDKFQMLIFQRKKRLISPFFQFFLRKCYCMTFYDQFDLFVLFWPRALTLGKSQFDKTLNSAFFSNTNLT